MTESERQSLRKLRTKYNRAYRARQKELAEQVTANIIETTEVPFDPLGRERFEELRRAIREGRA